MKKNILILCTGNSCRSQLAHGYLEKLAADKLNVYSAGIETHGLNPRAVKVIAEDGIDISHYTSNHIDEYKLVPFDFIITVCNHANENCPWFPSNAKRFHHNFTDPAKATGTDEEVMDAFRKVRDEIKNYCQKFISEELP